MPIVGLTTNGAAFPRIGELRKGGEKTDPKRPGPDLTYFRFTSTNEAVVKKFAAVYDSQPQSVNIFLPYATVDENFEAWQEEWGAGSLKHRCDGEYVVMIQRNGKYEQPEHGAVKCPGNCKQVGRLKVIIPELGRLAYVVALTTSIWDITEVHSNLAAYEALRGDLRGIPFILSRVPRMISTPGKDGRVRREKWLWHIEAAPEWVQAQLSVMQRQALPNIQQQYLGSGRYNDSAYVDENTGEIIEPEDVIDADFDQTNPHDEEEFNQDDKPSKLLGVPETVSPNEVELTGRDDYEHHISPGTNDLVKGDEVLVAGKDNEVLGTYQGTIQNLKKPGAVLYTVLIDGANFNVSPDKVKKVERDDEPLFDEPVGSNNDDNL